MVVNNVVNQCVSKLNEKINRDFTKPMFDEVQMRHFTSDQVEKEDKKRVIIILTLQGKCFNMIKKIFLLNVPTKE